MKLSLNSTSGLYTDARSLDPGLFAGLRNRFVYLGLGPNLVSVKGFMTPFSRSKGLCANVSCTLPHWGLSCVARDVIPLPVMKVMLLPQKKKIQKISGILSPINADLVPVPRKIGIRIREHPVQTWDCQ